MPDRIQLSRAAGWRKTEGAVVVARPSIWGNPWRIGDPGTFWLRDETIADARLLRPLDAETAVWLYRNLIAHGPDPIDDLLPTELTLSGQRRIRDSLRQHGSRIRARLHELRDKNLACWCPLDSPCHADVLLEIANA